MMVSRKELFDDTLNLLETLDQNQLSAVHAVIVELSAKNREGNSPLGIRTEEQLWEHIDHSLKQAKQEIYFIY